MEQGIPVEIKALMPGFKETIKVLTEGIKQSDVSYKPFPEFFGIERETHQAHNGNTLGDGGYIPKMYLPPKPFDTALAAVGDFLTAFRNFIENDKPKEIVWRVRPEINRDVDVDTFKTGYQVYARLSFKA